MPLQNSLYTYRYLHISRWALRDIILENSCLLADIFTFRDFFRGHLENGQASKKLASKTCRIFLERTKISKNQARKLTAKGDTKISF